MTFRSKFAKGALASAAGIAALTVAAAAPTTAAAQPYGYNYDPCRRDQTERGTAGALVGGALGAVIGSNAAARNARTEGALLGGAVGAAIGAGVGSNSAACRSGYDQGRYAPYNAPHGAGYYNQPYTYGGYQQPYGYDSRYDNRYSGGYYGSGYYDDDYGYAYGRRGERFRVTQRAGADGCSLAESPIYMPDGRVQTRFVRVCMDSRGQYQVVD